MITTRRARCSASPCSATPASSSRSRPSPRRQDKVASAKYPRLWRDLLTASASAAGDAVRITLPGGKAVLSTDPEVDAVLSELLDEPVTLTGTRPPAASLDRAVPEAVLRAGIDAQVPFEVSEIGRGSPPGTFVDFAPLHLLTTSTLDRIAELSPYRRARLERYRPNIVIRTPAPGFTENDWLEYHLCIGEELTLRVVARHNRVQALDSLTPEPCAGVYAEVLNPGRIRTGDPVRLYAMSSA